MTQRTPRESGGPRRPAAGSPVEPRRPVSAEKPTPAEKPAAAVKPAAAETPAAEKPAPARLPALGEDPLRPMPPPPPGVPLTERLKRIPPVVAILTVAAVLSLGFLLYEIASRTASVALLSSAGLVCGLVYVAVTIGCSAATWQLGHEGRLGMALLVAFIGGCAAFVAAASFAGALVLFLALGF